MSYVYVLDHVNMFVLHFFHPPVFSPESFDASEMPSGFRKTVPRLVKIMDFDGMTSGVSFDKD